MKDTTTKEQLQVELGKIRQSHGDWVASDERRREIHGFPNYPVDS